MRAHDQRSLEGKPERGMLVSMMSMHVLTVYTGVYGVAVSNADGGDH